MQTNDLKIVYVPVADLKPSEYNPRRHPVEAMTALKESITRFDMVDPVIANSAPERMNILVGGHMRLKALQELGRETVPVVYLNIPELEREKELNLRLNKNTGEFDLELLADFGEVFLKDVGFSSEEIDDIFPDEENPTQFSMKDELEKLGIENVTVQKGDVYDLDGSRLMCGDSTIESDMLTLFGDERADMCMTDPPYILDYLHGKKRHGQATEGFGLRRDRKYLETDVLPDNFTELWMANVAKIQKKDFSIIVYENPKNLRTIWNELEKHWKYRNTLVWVIHNRVQGYAGKHKFFNKHDIALVGTGGDIELNMEPEDELFQNEYESALFATSGKPQWESYGKDKKYCLYARKSTESDEKQALSIDSQIKEMLQIAEREALEIIDIRRESHSAKDSGQRPVYKELLEDIRRGRYNGILTWAPDRLSRNAGDLGELVDLMDQKLLLEIRTHGQHFHNSPNEKFLLMILCSQAKLENDNKSINVKRGLRTRVEMGLWPAPAPTGYLKEKRMDRKCETLIDPDRGMVIKKMFEKVAYERWSGRKVYNWLKFELNFKTAGGNKNLTVSNIYCILENHFYYGVFEYPKNSGNWYQGKHEPLITKELFDQVQAQVKSQFVRSESKEFAFTKLMTCGLCNSGITADEKLKKQKNGNVHRHVYYGCTKKKDPNCKSGYINEIDLIEQFVGLMNTINIDEIGIKEKIRLEIERIKKFQRAVLCTKDKIEVRDIDIRNYAKYVLQEATDIEKRELLGCLRSKIILKNKEIALMI